MKPLECVSHRVATLDLTLNKSASFIRITSLFIMFDFLVNIKILPITIS